MIKTLLFHFVSVLSLALFAAAQAENDKSNLLSVVVVYRHGARTPKKLYTNDPYNNFNFTPTGKEQLTNEGKNQQYALGHWLRTRYSDWLPETYNPSDIYVQSTDTDRSLMSAQCNLAGLFPPKGDQIWNMSIPQWQPIPIHTVPRKQDPVLAMKQDCPKWKKLRDAVDNDELFQKLYSSYENVFDYVSNHTGDEVRTFKAMKAIFDTLYIEKEQFNLTLPEWTESVYPAPMDFFTGYSLIQDTYTRDLARLKIGRMFRTIYKHFKAIEDDPADEPKFLMFSAHESMISNLLNTIGAFDLRRPPYASALIFEQRSAKKGSYINIYYKKYDVLQPITIYGCGYDCTRKEFKELLDDVIVKSAAWDAECNSIKDSLRNNSYYSSDNNGTDVDDV